MGSVSGFHRKSFHRFIWVSICTTKSMVAVHIAGKMAASMKGILIPTKSTIDEI